MLENKLGLTSSAELAREEERISKKKAAMLFENHILDNLESGKFSTLQTIHKYLFDEIYDFAGKLRTVNIAKGNFRFAPLMYIESALKNIDEMPQSNFDEIIEKYVEMNIAHPFREGNGRSARIWLDHMLKTEIGKVIDWSKVDKEDYLLAMERSPIRDIEIKYVLKNALTDEIDSREVYMKGIDHSYYYEGYTAFKADDVKPVKRSLPASDADLPEVTLFITAFNEEDVVDEKMENSLELDYPADKLHIVWVTDGSNDGTNERLQTRWQGKATVHFQPLRQGKTAAMTRGMTLVDTPLVVFTDANTMVNREAIREIVLAFQDPKVGCVAGEKRIAVQTKDGAAAGGEGIYWKYESTLKALDARLYSTVGAAGELFAVRNELFEAMEPDTLLDDFILSLRITMKGYTIAYCTNAYAIESGSADMREEEKRKVRIAAGGLQSIWRLRPLLNPFRYGILSFQYTSHRVLRWSITPFLLFALFPLNIAILLLGGSTIFYGVLLAMQVLFYGLGYWGYYLSTKQIKNKLLFIPYYFLFMNVNVLKGIRYLKKKKGSGAWEKAKRAEK